MSWLEISCDPITSTGQKRDKMWERILQRYNLRRRENYERTMRSLQSRWDVMKAEVAKFASFYADAIRENPSGMSDADKINMLHIKITLLMLIEKLLDELKSAQIVGSLALMKFISTLTACDPCKPLADIGTELNYVLLQTTLAASNFAAILKRNFAYMHCWQIMKDEPKWQEPKTRSVAKSAGGDGEATINLEDDNGTQAAEAEERPTGRDSAKAPKKKANSDAGSTSSSEYAQRMQDLSLQRMSLMQQESERKNTRFQQLAGIDEKRFEEMRTHRESLLQCEQVKIQCEQEKIRIMREKHDLEKEKEEKQEDERILAIKLDECTPSQRLYYETLQEEILEKMAARRRKRQAP